MAVASQQVIAGLYAAFFTRAPDKNGLDYWQEKAAGGNSQDVFNEIAAGFATHPKFSELYDSLDNQQFVEAIYKNVLGFEGDAEGINYWTGLINGSSSRSDMVAGFVYSSLNVNLDDAQWSNLSAEEKTTAQNRQDTIMNKADTGLYFVEQFGEATNITVPTNLQDDPAYLASMDILADVDYTAASVTVAQGKVALDSSGKFSLPSNGTGIELDTSVVVFDTVNGVSSSHSDRVFQEGVSYTVYVVIGRKGTGFDASERWIASNLGADDRIILAGPVGNEMRATNESGRVLSRIITNREDGVVDYRWRADYGKNIASLEGDGDFYNFARSLRAGENRRYDLFADEWDTNPRLDFQFELYIIGIPAVIMSSQGLA